jgi:hypothetical protein
LISCFVEGMSIQRLLWRDVEADNDLRAATDRIKVDSVNINVDSVNITLYSLHSKLFEGYFFE